MKWWFGPARKPPKKNTCPRNSKRLGSDLWNTNESDAKEAVLIEVRN